MKQIGTEQTMTVAEVAEVLGLSYDTIMGKARDLGFSKNGVKTLLNEKQVTEIKALIVPRTLEVKSKVESAVTEIEKDETIARAMFYLQERLEVAEQARVKAERKVALLAHGGKTYTATELAKELNMRSAQELNNTLEELKMQYKVNGTWVLTADYSERGFTEIKQIELENGKVVYDRRFTQLGRDFLLEKLAVKDGE